MGCLLKGLGILFVLMVIGSILAKMDGSTPARPRPTEPDSPEIKALKASIARDQARAECAEREERPVDCCWKCSGAVGARQAGLPCRLPPGGESVDCFETCVAGLPEACR